MNYNSLSKTNFYRTTAHGTIKLTSLVLSLPSMFLYTMNISKQPARMVNMLPKNHRKGCNFVKFLVIFHFLRRMTLKEMWASIFNEFLNIPSCSSLPSWPNTNSLMRTSLKKEVAASPIEWKKSLERFNTYVKFDKKS